MIIDLAMLYFVICMLESGG